MGYKPLDSKGRPRKHKGVQEAPIERAQKPTLGAQAAPTTGQAFVLCAGVYKRWPLPYPKQLHVLPNRETILGRTLRMVGEMGWTSVVVTHSQVLQQKALTYGSQFLIPEARRYTCETWLSTRAEWRERVAILLGDVYWDKGDLQDTLKCNGVLRVRGNTQELFAVTYGPEDFDRVEEVLRRAIRDAEQHSIIGHGKVWNFYRLWCGFQATQHKFDNVVLYRTKNHLTRDLDTLDAWNGLKGLLGKGGTR